MKEVFTRWEDVCMVAFTVVIATIIAVKNLVAAGVLGPVLLYVHYRPAGDAGPAVEA